MSKLLVIIGISGAQGSSVHNVFKNEAGWRIRGITRDPAKHQHLESEGVELVKANLDDQASLEQAFTGANAVFAMSDFFQPLFNGTAMVEKARREGQKPGELALQNDFAQGKNIVHAAAKQLQTLDRLVFSTLSAASIWSRGEVTGNYHFDSTAMTVQYLKDQFPELAAKTSYLQLGNFFVNWRYLAPAMFKKQEDRSMLIKYLHLRDSQPQPWVDASHDTGHFVRALILSDQAPPGTTMAGYRDKLMTIEEYVALWGKINGARTSYEPLTLEDMIASGMPGWLAEELEISGYYCSKYGCSGGDPEVKAPMDCGVDMSKLPSVEDWIRNEDWSSVL